MPSEHLPACSRASASLFRFMYESLAVLFLQPAATGKH